MRAFVLLTMIGLACSKAKSPGDTVATAESSAGSSAAAPNDKADAAELELAHVTLLQPDPVIEKRVKDQSELAGSLKHVPTLVMSYDERHPGVLPANFDVVVVARPTALRGWLVAASGDISVPELEKSIAAMPRFAVIEGNIGVVLTFIRVGTEPTPRDPYFPASWKAAAGGPTEIDDLIDKAWPR